MNERETIDRGWYYVIEPDGGRWAPADERILADDGAVLTRRLHGHPQRVELIDESGEPSLPATWLRASNALGRALESLQHRGVHAIVRLGPAGTAPTLDHAPDGRLRLHLDGPALAAAPSHHPIEAEVRALLVANGPVQSATPQPLPAELPDAPVKRAMFFESLMNTDMPHNDKEISQGVLHMASALRHTGTEVVLVNAKMSIIGDHRPVIGLDRIERALEGGPVKLVCITLLEGYWDGVVRLINTLRRLGCRAHIAVGGVMPSLAPEHVAAHLPEVSFVCRGAGEYFVPKLAQILGDHDVDTPLTEAQRRALLALDGMLALDRHAGRLLSCNDARTMQVESLDRIELDLSYVEPRHIEGGIEISTSRGCIHKCSFCSILGRESYQARSAGSIIDVLNLYHARYTELFGDRIPHNAWRVHFSDDDFACDRERARDLFLRLRSTPFRLSSVQVAIGDLCVKRDGKLLTEPDHELLDAMSPECFADHGRPIPKIDFFEDHKSRTWSSFLQIGVETYSDPEIARLGKGYKVAHVRTIVAELARRGIHMDGYFILSNVDTEARDLVDVFSEVARLKLRFPEHFHMRFPVVQYLVSYFTAASHRRHVRRGRRDAMILRDHASAPQHQEYDYPFVDHDVPTDPWVRDTVAEPFVTDEGLYTANLDVIAQLWRNRLRKLDPTHPDHARIGRLLRKLDDRPRRLVFEMLRQAWLGDDDGWPGARLDKERCLETAEIVLGRHQAWMPLLKHHVNADPERRLVLLCAGPSGPTEPTIGEQAVELLLSSELRALCLQLTGPDASLNAPSALPWIHHARQLAADKRDPKQLRVLVDLLAWHGPFDPLRLPGVELQLHLPTSAPDAVRRAAEARDAGLPVRVVFTLHPDQLDDLLPTVTGLLSNGLHDLVLEPAAAGWTPERTQALGKALFALDPLLQRHPELIVSDLLSDRERSGTTDDVAVSWDGQITRADLLRHTGPVPRAWRLGALSDLSHVDRHHLELAVPTLLRRAPTLDQLHKERAPAEKVLRSFLAWMQRRTSVELPEARV